MECTMRVIAIIQARMGSTRLHGKVLMCVEERPLLWYQIERLKRCKKISKIVIATSVSSQDDAIEVFCMKNKIDCFRGSENDVLDRYYQCAVTYKADIVVRTTGDCPLIDPYLTDEAVGYYLENKDFDLVKTGPSYPEGFDVEVFPFNSLEVARNEAKLKSEREHVTPFLWKNDQRFKIKILSLKKDYSFLRLTVDELVDFDVVKTVIEKLHKKNGTIFYLEDILDLYKKRPGIFEKNKNVIRNEGYQKSLQEDKK